MTNHPLIETFKEPVFKNLGLNDHEKLIILGPCAVESLSQMEKIAQFLKENQIKFLRAGCFKPRTSVYDFQGLGIKGLEILKTIKEKYGLKIVSEITSLDQMPEMLNIVDIFQVGARNMQNFALLNELGKSNVPVILKRGFGNTLDELLSAAEYILSGGNRNVILCERGIRTFETSTRSILDLGSVIVIKNNYQIPIITDPSHAAGHHELVIPLAKASLASGADGLIVEIHNDPSKCLSDKEQALNFDEAKKLIQTTKGAF